MIEAVYHRDDYRLTLCGHARSGDAGRDLVCAAASILVYTAAQNVRQLLEYKQAVSVQIRLEPGDAEIGCEPKAGFDAVTRLILDTICKGFLLLADQYPEYISFTVREAKDRE